MPGSLGEMKPTCAQWLLCVLCLSPACKPEVGDSSAIGPIEAWNAWLEDGDKRLKYCKMAASPFAFFRGTAHLYWDRYGEDPRLDVLGAADTVTVIQGDAHVLNFGAFDDDRGEVVYDLNDFDESVLADVQLDVWRFAASIALMDDQATIAMRLTTPPQLAGHFLAAVQHR